MIQISIDSARKGNKPAILMIAEASEVDVPNIHIAGLVDYEDINKVDIDLKALRECLSEIGKEKAEYLEEALERTIARLTDIKDQILKAKL